MSREVRKYSESGYYHVMIRGVNKQIIFESDTDKTFFIDSLMIAKAKYEIKVIAYCLMENHVHLLIKDNIGDLSKFMQSLNTRYAIYFNLKYCRMGPLFQDRFRSEIINDDRRLLAAYRYILNNPYKAGICYAWDYKWNSFWHYGKHPSWLDTEIVEDLIGDVQDHYNFIQSYHDENFIDIDGTKVNNYEAKKLLKKCLHINSTTQISKFDKKSRDKALLLLSKNGLSNKQIQRLTGVSESIIKRTLSKPVGDGGCGTFLLKEDSG